MASWECTLKELRESQSLLPSALHGPGANLWWRNFGLYSGTHSHRWPVSRRVKVAEARCRSGAHQLSTRLS